MRPAAMKRTTVMLPDGLRRRALARAKQKGVSLGELIRHSLDASLPAVSYHDETDPLFENVIYDGPAPADLSTKHDKHLYDNDEEK